MRTLRVALAQINATVGDIEGNVKKIAEGIERAKEVRADVVAFPELAVTGYPPEDLLFKPHFIALNKEAVNELAKLVPKSLVAVVGFVDEDSDDIFNAAAVLHDGKIATVYRKHYLPNYGVFDEFRYFCQGSEALVLALNDARVGITICEDIWYPGGPARAEALLGDAHLLLNISSSPYHMGKLVWRERMLGVRANDNLAAVAYVNLVGGQDELVFDGASLVVNEQGEVIARAKQFEEDFLVADIDLVGIIRSRLHDPRRRQDKQGLGIAGQGLDGVKVKVVALPFEPAEPKPAVESRIETPLPKVAEVYWALVLGTRDYLHKNGMRDAVIGLSGGIDSSLTCCIAVDALGREHVTGVAMPGPYSSQHSLEDAEALARNLGIRFLVIPITGVFEAFLQALSEAFRGLPHDVTEENLQARIRGTILMALSNKFGWLVLTTGNKSEGSTGYCTLYGDTAGGFAVLKDVYKTLVYELAAYANEKAGREIIPRRVFEKPPSAELRPGQVDQEKLPPYPLLDAILQAYVEEDRSVADIMAMGYDEATVRKVAWMVDSSEYKRRQFPPGPKITRRAFGRDRRLPITNRFREWKVETNE
ncbi:NAD+ synthase [Fervidibacter sacchari]|uniref:Glutamine-dependent NAD(+) synthetase n=1 Tax=Candidatus Fervidibacter sacchari TaxID=1448929 RepID=A0ABT2EL43_9BACT|nr:NAD+ synthase [Candidatus Fervidibacter sacchari]MCS3917668.1 NAD+ synthase (glutamine-hydrolyzing) [Candidatus Fervidibacter sacchari]WKU15498.1 NAD+ synthase [Candidatus Fervidibacter sacchari]